MLLLLSIAHYKKGVAFESEYIFLILGGIAMYILPMLLLNFIVQKNDLTYKGTYTILLYAFLTGILLNSLTDIRILIASGLVILGLRNVLRLRDEKYMKAKIFNASLCIGIASLAYFWSIGFIFLVFFAVFYFEPKNYRNWIIPLIALTMIYMFANCFTLLFYDSFFTLTNYVDPVSFSFENYLNKDKLFSIGILSLCTAFFLSIFLIKYSRKTANIKPILRLMIVYLIIAIGVGVVAPEKNTSELFFTTAPLAIIGTTYLETNYNMLAKEINIWVFVFIPFTMLLF